MSVDLELTQKHDTNQRLGQFVCMCVNNIGIEMERKRDKPPSGTQLLGKSPTPAYRWTSERSPLFAWMFSTCLGLGWDETTTTHQIHMDWILGMPVSFRVRFIQGVADSDGCVKGYIVDLASVPNAHFFAKVLLSLGVTSAHAVYEKGVPTRTQANCRQASKLPFFNEFIKSYRYERMLGRNDS